MGWWLILLTIGLAGAQEICLAGDEDPYLLFGSKTSYIFANRGLPNVKTHEVPGCEPIAFWMLNRQGSNNPEPDEIERLQKLTDFRNIIVNNYKNGNFRDTNQRICSADLKLLTDWKWHEKHNMTYAGDLTSDGYMTTQQLARAFKQKYPGLLTQNRHKYLFKFTTDNRSSNSFRAFTEGLFGAQAEGYDIPKENDGKLIKPQKYCPTWKKEIEENNDTLLQQHIFKSKLEFKEMITNISLRLGFNYDIQESSVYDMYQMCRYNKAWDVAVISPWCSVFSHEDLKRLEYAEDLETYYKYGYGSILKNKIGCLPVKEMINFFNGHITKEVPNHPSSMITFTDHAMLLSALTALNTHLDQAPLTGDNYRTNQVQSRKWTTSTMAPFNGNLAAVLYKCTPNGNFQINDQHQVLFLGNEHPIYMEGCRVGLCDWSFVKSKYAELLSNCDLEFCNGATKTGFGLSVSLFVSVVVSFLLM